MTAPGRSGRPLGILMLDARFPRPPGDVGHVATWPFPVLFEIIPKATSALVVRGDAGSIIDAAVAAGERLAAAGAIGLTTSCGFLALLQRELSARMPIPIATSSLMQIPFVARTLAPGARIGVITYDGAALTPRHFESVGAPGDTTVAGLPADGEFRGMIEGGRPYRRAALEAEVLAVARALVAREPAVAAIVLECTNLPPFSRAIHAATGLPVYDLVSLGEWFYAGLAGGRVYDDGA